MAKDQSRQEHPGDLRRRAEDALNRKKTGKPARTMPEEDVRALVHELQVHQIELEMQNEELKRANALVEETRNRYAHLYEFAPVGYLTFDENGVVLEANLTATTRLGMERSDLIKRPFQDYIVPADRDKFRSHLNKVVTSKKRQSCEIGLMTKSGDDFYALLDTLLILDSSGKNLCRTTATDITERKLIEDTQVFLAQSGRIASGEDFFESLARYLGQSLGMDFVCIDRLEGDLLSARTLAVYFDGKFEDNVTYTLKDTPCSEVVEKKVCCFPKGVRHLFPKDEILQEMKAESYVGTILWGSKEQPIGLIAVIGRQPLANRHLAESVLQLVAVRAAGELERRLVEEELRENRSRLDLALQSAHMGVWRLDLIENKRHFDDQVCHLLGIAPAKFTGTEEEFYKAVHHDDREMLKAVWARTIEKDVPYEAEYRALWPNGSVHYVTARGKLVHDDKGRPVMVNGLIWDITERKSMEEELRRSRNELELRVDERTAELSATVNKLEQLNEELQEFAFVASHDLQEPLRKIQAFGGILMKKHKETLNPEGQDYMERITKGANRMSELLRALLGYSRVGTSQLNYQPVSLTEVVKDATSDLEILIYKAKGNVEISELPTVDADAALLRQLFQNVIRNSLKYCKESEPPIVKIYGRIAGSVCHVFIEDNGIGFDECYCHKIFKPFERLHGKNSPYSGTGMGLSISRKIVNRHGGEITVRSIPEQGTTFIVTLPIEQKTGA